MALTVYKATTGNGDFVAFWKSDKNTISYFHPEARSGAYFNHSLTGWKEQRASYKSFADNPPSNPIGKSDIDDYPDVVNAAWHYGFRHNMLLIAKHSIVRSTIEPGIYYPRIWRAYYHQRDFYMGYNPINPRTAYGNKHLQSVLAASSLFDNLVDIFGNIEPSKKNFRTFGHKIRELLILVSTEVEVGWRYVLEENTDPTKLAHLKGRYTTQHYFRVKDALRLAEWTVTLKEYPELGNFTPFKGWKLSLPTRSLPWYDSYNAVKHDRESSFEQATLGNLLNAMAALHIMQAAQWGVEVYSRWHEDRSSPFRVVRFPTFRLSEIYMPSLDGTGAFTTARYFDR